MTATRRKRRDCPAKATIGDPMSPYLTVEEAARYLRFDTVRSFHRWLESNPAVKLRLSDRRLRFDRRALDAYARDYPWTFRNFRHRKAS